MIGRTLPLVAALVVSPALAGEVKLASGYEHTGFSDGQGRRDVATLEIASRQGQATLVGNIASGRRRYGDGERWDATRGAGTLYYDWGRRLSTRTSLAIAGNTPVFARRELGNDFNIKWGPRSVVLLGIKHSDYYGGLDANAWSIGTSLYLQRWVASYRYTFYDLSNGGNSYANVLSLKRKDSVGQGSTQLWIGQGTGVYAYDWTSRLQGGRLKNISLRRTQPVGEALVIGLGIGKAWYDTPLARYDGVSISADLRLRW